MNADTIEFSPDLSLDNVDAEQVDKNPLLRFRKHFEQVLGQGIDKPNAACLATANQQGRPSARIILIKQISNSGFVFFTNYQSHKGLDLEVNPYAELVFYWPTIDTQVRAYGEVSRISQQGSEAYFHKRPRASQLGATVSPQSRVIASREDLENTINELDVQLKDQEIPLPNHWGGYCIRPLQMEYWYNRGARLHDRFQFEYGAGKWQARRLAP